MWPTHFDQPLTKSETTVDSDHDVIRTKMHLKALEQQCYLIMEYDTIYTLYCNIKIQLFNFIGTIYTMSFEVTQN